MTTPLHETPTEETAVETIHFAIGPCWLGLVLVATSAKGICAVLLGANEKTLVAQIRSIFPRAIFQTESKKCDEVLRTIIPLIETPAASVDLLLDIRGTGLQKAVWNALRDIQVGQTVTYKELALKFGVSAQEIGEACAANTIAMLIPCHRVVRSDGGLAGYRWEMNRKKRLLQREQELAPDPDSLFALPARRKGR